MTNRLIRIVSTLILMTLLVSACIPTAATESTQPLRVGWSLWPGMYPMIIAEEQGLFEKHGVEVESLMYDSYRDVIPALGSGMLDGGSLALTDILLNDVSEDIKVVLICDESSGADQIVASPEIQSIQDLRGKRIGILRGTYGEMLVQEMLDANGISLSEVILVDVSVEQIPDAIPSLVDAGHTFEPYASQARAKGNLAIFTTANTPGLVLDVFGFRQDTLQNRPNDVRAFVAAWFDAVQYWQQNPAAGNALIAQKLGIDATEVSVEGVKLYSLSDNVSAFQDSNATGSIFYTARLQNQFLVGRGVISYPVQIDAEFLDASFLQQTTEE